MATTPWKPFNRLEIVDKEKGYRYKWERVDTLEKALGEGFAIVYNDSAKSTNKSQIESGNLDGTIRKGNLILCKIPEEMAQQREKYYRDRANNAIRGSESQYHSNVSTGYGTITIK